MLLTPHVRSCALAAASSPPQKRAVLLLEPFVIRADEPVEQYEPDSHERHSVWPLAPWYVPGAQKLQAVARSAAANEPAAQGVDVRLPIEHEWPTGQAVQLAASHRSVALE